jgi:hypothetical protein
METAKILITDAARVFGLLAAICAVPALLILLAPGFPRWIATFVVGIF